MHKNIKTNPNKLVVVFTLIKQPKPGGSISHVRTFHSGVLIIVHTFGI